MLRRALLLAVLAAAAGASPAVAADPVALGGSPLNVYVGERGQLQAFRTDRTVDPGIFFNSHSTTGDAGFFLAFGGTVYGFDTGAIGSGMTDYTPVSQGAAAGGSQVTRYDAGALQVTQTTTYVNGSQQFRVKWDVKNTGAAVDFKAFAAADFFFDGSDRGTGIYTVGPPQFVGGTNADTGNSGGFEEVPASSPWSAYEALAYGDDADQVWGKIKAAAASPAPVLSNHVVEEQVDNAGAVEWDVTGLANNATRTFELIARSAVPAALQLNPNNAGAPQGTPISINATATNTEGVPYAGRLLRYTILGANPGGGTVTLDAAGHGVMTDPGTNAGADTVVAYVDFNKSGVRDPVEPQASALATFVDNVAPACTVKITGDRPGGGGAGKPLIISVNCGEGGSVTVSTALVLPKAKASAAAKKKKAKRVKLKRKTVKVVAGKPLKVKLKIPRAVARKYAGKTLRAIITVTARDAGGNVKRATATRKVKLAKLKRR
jgi:hypothetical protein